MVHEPDAETLPVTVVSGPLGAGKTTLLNRVLDDPGSRDVAVIVNDMGEINVDAERLARSAKDVDDPGIVDLSNDCICCRLQDDLVTEATRLAETRSFDALVVESSGISEPIPVARTFLEGADDGEIDPTDHYHLDTMVSVLDSYGFWKEFDAGASLPDEAEPDADRPLADVLIQAIEFCDVLLCNKSDMVPDEQLQEIEATIRTLQSRAEIVRTTYADIDPSKVLDTGRFDFAAATRSAGWKRALADENGDDDHDGDGHSDHDHTAADDRSAAAEHGVTSFVYTRERPFHPERLDAWLDTWTGNVIRAKGVFQLAGREAVMGLDQAGPAVQAGPIGEWDAEDDRRTRLVFIGSDLDEQSLTATLDDCLVSESELDSQDAFDDPFPS